MHAIPAIRRTGLERVDGTLIVKFEIEPQYKAEFHRMFPEMDMAAAIAPLVKGITLPQPEAKPKGGENSKWAAMRCAEKRFWDFFEWLDYGKINSVSDAVIATRIITGVESRAEFDDGGIGEKAFHEKLRIPFIEYSNGPMNER